MKVDDYYGEGRGGRSTTSLPKEGAPLSSQPVAVDRWPKGIVATLRNWNLLNAVA